MRAPDVGLGDVKITEVEHIETDVDRTLEVMPVISENPDFLSPILDTISTWIDVRNNVKPYWSAGPVS